MTQAPSERDAMLALAKDCELYAKVIEGIIVVADDYRPGDPERREPRETLLKAVKALRAAAEAPEVRAHKVMTPEEYATMPIIGWHEVCRNIDGFDGVGIRFLGQPKENADEF